MKGGRDGVRRHRRPSDIGPRRSRHAVRAEDGARGADRGRRQRSAPTWVGTSSTSGDVFLHRLPGVSDRPEPRGDPVERFIHIRYADVRPDSAFTDDRHVGHEVADDVAGPVLEAGVVRTSLAVGSALSLPLARAVEARSLEAARGTDPHSHRTPREGIDVSQGHPTTRQSLLAGSDILIRSLAPIISDQRWRPDWPKGYPKGSFLHDPLTTL
jgi:hypothetical protein